MSKLTKDDLELVARGLAALLDAYREDKLAFARSHYIVEGPDGKPAYFRGDWNALLEDSKRFKQKAGWLAEYERLELDVEAVHSKLRALVEAKPTPRTVRRR